MAGQKETAAEAPLPLVLLPGTLCDARIFAPLLERLPPIESTVLLTPEARTMADAAEQVLAEAPETFALLGFSLGGMVAMEVALRAPHRVCGLALFSTSPRPVPAELHAARRASAAEAASIPMRDFVEQHLWHNYAAEANATDWLPLMQAMAEAQGHAAFASQTELALSRTDFRPRLQGIRCPTLIVAGREDKLCPPAAQDELASDVAHATRVMISGAGHLALLEKPDEIAQAVAAWLETAKQEHVRWSNDRLG